MPYRKTIFAKDEIYHVVNRGINHASIFENKNDYQRFISLIDFLRFLPGMQYSHFRRLPIEERRDFFETLRRRNKPVIECLAFCLMPNHFHLLLKQLETGGTQGFLRNLQNSYAKYCNAKYKRSGSLFQSPFHSVRIENDYQLNHVSRYIHLNPSSAYLVQAKDLKNYKYSSYNDYIKESAYEFVCPGLVLGNFKSKDQYENFVLEQAEDQRAINAIKHLVLENR